MAVFTHSFSHTLLLLILIIHHHHHRTTSEPTDDKQALLSFISSIRHASRIQWRSSDSVCSWTGITCDSTNSSVTYLRLPAAGLVGTIHPNTLGKLSNLRVLSLRSNALAGEIPSDFINLTLLRSLYLQNNRLSGKLPISVTNLTRLARLDLSGNNFSGSLPFSINNLVQLAGLMLQDNEFSGGIPSINQPSLVSINISNNKLNGSIPRSLSRFPVSAFSGNINLCGKPLPPCDNSFFNPPTPSPINSIEPPPLKKSSKKKLSKGAIIAIALGSALILLLLLLFLYLRLCAKRKQIQHPTPSPKPPASAMAEAGASSSKDDLTGGGSIDGERNKLVFFGGGGNDGVYGFDLEDLLRASAEVLGKGSVGTSYKAVLEEGTTVVVKRLKDVSVSKKEFESQMAVLGRISNENVVPLRAFYYSKDEKLLVTDFMAAGSLSAFLHGSRGSDRTPLDWDHRMRIALTAAKGVAHLHIAANVVHGNIKSSNILLRDATNVDAFVSDYGLNTLFTKPSTPNHRGSGYRAPEVLEARKVTSKSDVYSFGVLLLELLTGKSPNQASLGEEGMDLPRWVQSVVREEWTAEVFDVELTMYNNIEEEMVQLLQIAMACVSTVPDQRPAMQEVVKMMEEMNRVEADDGLRQSSDDPSRGSGGHTPPTETRSSPRDVTP